MKTFISILLIGVIGYILKLLLEDFINMTVVTPEGCFIRRMDFFFCSTVYAYHPHIERETILVSRFGAKKMIGWTINEPDTLYICNANKSLWFWRSTYDRGLMVVGNGNGSLIRCDLWQDYAKTFQRAERKILRAGKRFEPARIAGLKKT